MCRERRGVQGLGNCVALHGHSCRVFALVAEPLDVAGMELHNGLRGVRIPNFAGLDFALLRHGEQGARRTSKEFSCLFFGHPFDPRRGLQGGVKLHSLAQRSTPRTDSTGSAVAQT